MSETSSGVIDKSGLCAFVQSVRFASIPKPISVIYESPEQFKLFVGHAFARWKPPNDKSNR